ncbi:hypothetical protein ACIQXM_12170 [Arthrobacter sp. NPDC097144]|uniref:hypothetical protein n=1 Tax=Arthrobacter sp. NPDC097144 TaxID=3363946 RepID=UPI0038165200
MSEAHKLSRNEAAEFLAELGRDISAARLRVSLDGKLGRETPAPVKKLASLPDPPSIDVSGAEASPDRQAAAFRLATEAVLEKLMVDVPVRAAGAVLFFPMDDDDEPVVASGEAATIRSRLKQ